MRTPRQTAIRRAILEPLSRVPREFLVTDRILRIEAADAMLPPPPTASEYDTEIREADVLGLVVSVVGEDAIMRQITDAGRAWLAKHA